MFPRQFGLHNVFTHTTDRRETTHAFKDYTDREAEIGGTLNERDNKSFRRLRDVVPLVVKTQKLHKSCSYYAMIQHYCPEMDLEPDIVGNDSLESNETSKVITQKEISMTSTKSSEGEVDVSSNEGDIIRHFTPHHRVFSQASRGNL
jgi:hypothetical protein